MKQSILLIYSALAAVNCIGIDNKPVDYFFLLKMPKDSDKNPEGVAYYYSDSTNKTFSYYNDINSEYSPVNLTLTNINKDINNLGRLYWNDEPYNHSTSIAKAHSKGMIFFDKDSSIYFNHSFPKFPQMNDGKIDPLVQEGELHYGQSMFCFSPNINDLEKIGKNLVIEGLDYYDECEIPSSLKDVSPTLNSLVDKKSNMLLNMVEERLFAASDKPGWGLEEFRVKDLDIKHIAKSKYQLSQFYEHVAEVLESNVQSETWGNGKGGLLDPNCNNTYVDKSVLTMDFEKQSYKYTKDHSKIAISDKHHVCFGDINRQETQNKRGGGTFCMVDEELWSQLNKIMSSTQSC